MRKKCYFNGGTDMTCGELGYRFSFQSLHKTKEEALKWLRRQTTLLENFKGFDTDDPRRGFDENKQYSDWVIVTELEPEDNRPTTEKVKAIKKEFQWQIDRLIPTRLQHKIKWLTQYHEAGKIKVKEDNYEQLGMREEDVGGILDIDEHWTVSWKYYPNPPRVAELKQPPQPLSGDKFMSKS